VGRVLRRAARAVPIAVSPLLVCPISGHLPILSKLRTSRALARVYRASDRPMSARHRDLVQRRVSRAWPPRPSIQSVTYLVKYERPDIALFCAKVRLANDVRLAPVGHARFRDAPEPAPPR